jgi:prophage regulatory protein
MRLLSLSQTVLKLSLSKATIYRLIKAGTFPHQLHLSPGKIGFLEADLDDWIRNKVVAAKAGV